MEKEIWIFNNPAKGYVFCAGTVALPRMMHTFAKPAILLPSEDASEENIGKCFRQTMELGKNAPVIDLEKEGIYEYWKDAGYKTNGRFTKEHICMEFTEIEDKYYYRRWPYFKQGCYVAACRSYERDYVNNNISNKELGRLITDQMKTFEGFDFKERTKYVWDGSMWINNKAKNNT